MSKKLGDPTNGLNGIFGRAKLGVNPDEEKISANNRIPNNEVKEIKTNVLKKELREIIEVEKVNVNISKKNYDSKHTVIRIPKALYHDFSEIAKLSGYPAKRIVERLLLKLVNSDNPCEDIAELVRYERKR